MEIVFEVKNSTGGIMVSFEQGFVKMKDMFTLEMYKGIPIVYISKFPLDNIPYYDNVIKSAFNIISIVHKNKEKKEESIFNVQQIIDNLIVPI